MPKRADRREFRRTIIDAMRKRAIAQLAAARMSGDVKADWAKYVNAVLLASNDLGKLQAVYQSLLAGSTGVTPWLLVRAQVYHALWPFARPSNQASEQLREMSATRIIHDEVTDIVDPSSYAHQYYRQAQNSRPPRKLSPTGRALR